MHSLFWKGMLAFLAVILVAVGTVALLSGWITEVEFRRYTLTQEGRWERQVAESGRLLRRARLLGGDSGYAASHPGRRDLDEVAGGAGE